MHATPNEEMALRFVGHEKVFGFAGGLSTQLYSQDETKVEIQRKRQLLFNKGEIFCIIYFFRVIAFLTYSW